MLSAQHKMVKNICSQGVLTPQAWIRKRRRSCRTAEYSRYQADPNPWTPKSLAWPRTTRLSGQLPSPTEKPLLLICILQVGCCMSLHPLGGAEHKTTSFPFHAGNVYTICVLVLFFFFTAEVKHLVCHPFWGGAPCLGRSQV